MYSYYYNNNNYQANNHSNIPIFNNLNNEIGYDLNKNSNYNLCENKFLFQTSQIKKKCDISFENLIYFEISQCKYKVLSKKEILNRYGKGINGIGNLIMGPNFIVTIKNKWSEINPSQNEVCNFIESTKLIGQLENKCYLGIYLSKFPISLNSQYTIDHENLSLNNRFISISSNIHSQITYELQSILYSYGIYYFESDGSTIML
jgi:hypothetical protein